uniref:Uncharacterized protein n=1 Tax=Microviridae sp. ct05d3 TaxID=2824982 RepID=A0A8S5V183_9VIRU|nr:MAG TPA: hypothetical protein [Microviridae sp. ct05d3]
MNKILNKCLFYKVSVYGVACNKISLLYILCKIRF